MRGTLFPGVDCPTVPQANIDCVHRDDIGEIVSSPLEWHSETSNDQALLNPSYHCIILKAYMRVEKGRELYPDRGRRGHFISG